MGRTDLTADGVAGLEVELADLRRRDVDVVGAGEVVVVGRAQAARRCASETFSGSERTACRSESAIRSRTSFIVSWIRVLGLWNFRVALDASWQSIYRLRRVCKASKTRSERMILGSPKFQESAGLTLPALGQQQRNPRGTGSLFIRWALYGIVSYTRNDAPQFPKVAQFSGFGPCERRFVPDGLQNRYF